MNDIEIEMQVKYMNLDLPMYERQIRRTVYKIILNCIKRRRDLSNTLSKNKWELEV